MSVSFLFILHEKTQSGTRRFHDVLFEAFDLPQWFNVPFLVKSVDMTNRTAGKLYIIKNKNVARLKNCNRSTA